MKTVENPTVEDSSGPHDACLTSYSGVYPTPKQICHCGVTEGQRDTFLKKQQFLGPEGNNTGEQVSSLTIN